MVEVITRAPESMFGFVSATLMSLAVLTLLPNMRLKLAGGDRFKGSGVLCAGAHELSFNHTSRGGDSPAV